METKDTYKSISSVSEGVFRDKGSRFIAKAYPVESEEEVKAIVDSLRKEYHDARHHCYAYRLGLDGTLWRANDDGEPSGSAGRQILGQIDSAGLSDVLVVVIRYFGGILLGVPGLIRAYKTSTAEAISAAEIVEKTAARRFSVSFPYEMMPDVMKVLKDLSLEKRGLEFGEQCCLETSVRLNLVDIFLEKLNKKGIFINPFES